jgi:hypothetical protein
MQFWPPSRPRPVTPAAKTARVRTRAATGNSTSQRCVPVEWVLLDPDPHPMTKVPFAFSEEVFIIENGCALRLTASYRSLPTIADNIAVRIFTCMPPHPRGPRYRQRLRQSSPTLTFDHHPTDTTCLSTHPIFIGLIHLGAQPSFGRTVAPHDCQASVDADICQPGANLPNPCHTQRDGCAPQSVLS